MSPMKASIVILGKEIPAPSKAPALVAKWEKKTGHTARQGNRHNVLIGKRTISISSAMLALCGVPPINENGNGSYHTAYALRKFERAGYRIMLGENAPQYYPGAEKQTVKKSRKVARKGKVAKKNHK